MKRYYIAFRHYDKDLGGWQRWSSILFAHYEHWVFNSKKQALQALKREKRGSGDTWDYKLMEIE